MKTSSLTTVVKNASEIFFGHNPKYPLWILLALYLRKEGKLHIVENCIPENPVDNLIWGWENGADMENASEIFSKDIIAKWREKSINNICIVGDIAGDENLTSIVEAFKKEKASNNEQSVLFAPQWEPAFLLEVATLLLSIDDEAFKMLWSDEVFDDLLIRIFAKTRFKGEFMQPKELSSIVTSLIPTGGHSLKVYNPCCGVGTYITSDAPFVYYIGEEISDVIWGIAYLRTGWYGFTECTKVVLGDSIQSDIHDYSAIVSTPPFGVKHSKTDESILVKLIDKCLRKNVPGVFVVPASFCFSASYKSVRENLISKDAIEGVILLPSGMFAPCTGIQTAIIIINPQNEDSEGIVRFLDASSFVDEKTNKLVYSNIKDAWDGESDFKVSVHKTEIAQRDYVLTPTEYLDLNIDIPEGSRLMVLAEIGTFISESSKDSQDAVRWATLSSFGNANILKTYSTVEIATGKSMPHSLVINEDCVLISPVGGRGVSLHIDENGPIYTHHNNVAFIPDTDVILPQYLILELAKPYVANRIAGNGVSTFAKNAGRLKIVVPSIEEQKAAISQYQSDLLSQMGVEMSLLKTRREQESRQELETRKHRIGQILGDAVPAFESLYSFIQNADRPFTRETEVDELFHSTLIEEMTSIQKSLKKATQLLKALTDEIDYSKGVDIDFCDFVATNAKELVPHKTNVSWFGEFQENERPVIHFSEQDLKVIFENIFSNAKKYGFTDSSRGDYFISVNFRCVEVGNQSFLRLHISNNGSPLPSGMTPERVFEWGKGNGHGIGGWQIRNIVEHFGGTVSLEELPENPEGFTLRYAILIPLIESSYE